ncbi:1-acyl-sn-glycerol-3-phosphate acyltransferase [Deinococcus wulumuqiensis]|uniref:1-acyl-sn-glycerol-3-phosphate acyltransferase n=2 Tax=Deinococcus wulumuqiensis TaxID=980427 RepID=A0AAV4K750_9DEIO|nr:1-acyl-sn-glycerol-3-phosphate acyltransferase [Deinococcus wulumuqiensis]GGI91722.1 1-acyl-sn-glycerol-3-phosphate acyltransferase [Deinococcus wulumuqiensis]GGP31029.1 1-acyl-sn-glycerol-3-phosphate acyltransferase [Deinococcus wulumuqiensis]
MAVRQDWAGDMVRGSIRRSLRTDLAGVFVTGPLPPGGAVLAPNHQSWWDGYLLAELAWQLGQDCRVMMTERQLARFPFLRRAGAMGTGEVRAAVRHARSGGWVVVFPEGALQPPGPPGPLHPGAAWMARQAGVPLVPVGLRVLVRGAQKPEGFVRFGVAASPAELPGALGQTVARLDADLQAADPDAPPAGYLRWVRGAASVHDRPGLPARLLTRLTGDR